MTAQTEIHELNYKSALPRRETPAARNLGVASVSTATIYLVIGVLVRWEMAEALALQFYCYAAVFIFSFALGVSSLLVRSKQNRTAWIGMGISVIGLAWKLSSLYFSMRAAAANGWMTMPWPF